MHAIVTFLAKDLIVVPLVVIVVVWFRLPTFKEKKLFVIRALVAAVIVLLLAKIGSMLFYNPRPYVVGHFAPYFHVGTDNGFPSDHTLLSSYLAMVVYYANRKLGLALLATALIIGLARVIGGAHHLIDVAGAFAFSIVGVTLTVYLIRKFIRPQAGSAKTR